MFDTINTINAEMRRCTRCDLSIGRTQVVIPSGDLQSKIALIGHSPSGTDDASGRPYTGPAGEVLEELLFKVGLRRSQFYISNLVKCWPWKEVGDTRINRVPGAGEIKTCTGNWLQRELQLLQPKAIVCLGGPTAQHFLGKNFKITESRGVWQSLPASSPYAALFDSPPAVMAILQPAYLIHLEAHAPESYPATLEAMLTDLHEVKRVLEGGAFDAGPSDNAPF
jgi:uracil-DNA glycosylase